MNVKTKIRLGLLFLLAIIILLAGAGSYYVNRLSGESKDILKNNYNTLQYTKKMIEALDEEDSSGALQVFEQNLALQENNITEVGEKEATAEMHRLFTLYKDGKRYDGLKMQLRKQILQVQELNMDAIVKKNAVITQKAQNAFAYITMLGTISFLLSFTFVVNFPRWVADPIAQLTGGIKKIAAKDYSARVLVTGKDEFSEMALAFNNMAAELNTWEHSNVSQLMFEKSRIETLINNMQDAVIGLDENRKILFVNEVAENLMMLKKEDVIGMYAPDVAIKNDLLRNLLNKDDSSDLKIYANNKQSYFTKNYRTVKNQHSVIGEVIVLHNVTPFKELDSAKTNFLATVSHELKTPISAIKMCVQLLGNESNGKLNAEQKQLVESIGDDAERLLKITSELLNMTQIETGNIQLAITGVSAQKIVDLAVEAVGSLAEQKEVKMMANVETNLPLVSADLDKTVWVMVNLLSNAIKYSPVGGQIQINVQLHDKGVEFTVADNGPGIDKIYSEKVFDRYFKVPGSSGGTGLGLAISKEFIEAQNGTIWIDSTAGKGATFGFKLNTNA